MTNNETNTTFSCRRCRHETRLTKDTAKVGPLLLCDVCVGHYDQREQMRFGEFLGEMYDVLAAELGDKINDKDFGRLQEAIWVAAAPFVLR